MITLSEIETKKYKKIQEFLALKSKKENIVKKDEILIKPNESVTKNNKIKDSKNFYEKFQITGLVHDREDFSSTADDFADLKKTKSFDSFSNKNNFYKKGENGPQNTQKKVKNGYERDNRYNY